MRFSSLLSSTDIPFARDDAHRILPMMIACLVGFVTLLLSAVLCLNEGVHRQSDAVLGHVQLELPSGANRAMVEGALRILGNTKGVEDVTVLRRAEMEALLVPWLGKGFALGNLPLPILVDITTQTEYGKSVVDLTALANKLSALGRGIVLHDAGPWMVEFAGTLTWLQSAMLLVAFLLLLCCVAMVVLVARTHLRLHFKTVGLLHMFGATDDYILRQFQHNSALLAGRGALMGVAVASACLILLAILSAHSHNPILPDLRLTLAHGLLALTLPIFLALVAMLATRVTVRSMLSPMP